LSFPSTSTNYQMNIINTSVGPKTPAEAVSLIRQMRLPAGSLLGIFNQLEGAEAKEAAEFIISRPASFSPKLVNRAKELVTGLPATPKNVDQNNVHELFRSFGLNPSVRITFRKEIGSDMCRIVMLRKNFVMSDHDWAGLYAVAISRKWDMVSRTVTMTVIAGADEWSDIVRLIGRTAEKVELVSTIAQRAAVCG
jgi:hypothetical protein